MRLMQIWMAWALAFFLCIATPAQAMSASKALANPLATGLDTHYFPINHTDPDGLDFQVFGPASAARELKDQLEKFSGLSLSYGSDRRLKITGGDINNNAASRILGRVIGSDVVTKFRVISDYYPETGVGKYFTPDGLQQLSPHAVSDLAASVGDGIAAGALFHEIGEGFSRFTYGTKRAVQEDHASELNYARDHEGIANIFQVNVLRDYGLVNYGTYSWLFSDQNGKFFEVRKNYKVKYPMGQLGKHSL